uniref:Uncharacterized protein n=1 Tax=Cacopsylla melanoneura TaxID=428564 RepID=A0A8D8TZ35_9HEMI
MSIIPHSPKVSEVYSMDVPVLVQYILGTTMIFPSWLSMDVSIVQTILEKIIHYHLPGILCAIRGVLMFSGKASTFCTQIPFILRNRPLSPPNKGYTYPLESTSPTPLMEGGTKVWGGGI